MAVHEVGPCTRWDRLLIGITIPVLINPTQTQLPVDGFPALFGTTPLRSELRNARAS